MQYTLRSKESLISAICGCVNVKNVTHYIQIIHLMPDSSSLFMFPVFVRVCVCVRACLHLSIRDVSLPTCQGLFPLQLYEWCWEISMLVQWQQDQYRVLCMWGVQPGQLHDWWWSHRSLPVSGLPAKIGPLAKSSLAQLICHQAGQSRLHKPHRPTELTLCVLEPVLPGPTVH